MKTIEVINIPYYLIEYWYITIPLTYLIYWYLFVPIRTHLK